MRPYNEGYHPFKWRGFWDFGTGAMGDMGCHIMDPVFRILPIDYPSEVECCVTTNWSGFFQVHGGRSKFRHATGATFLEDRA